MTESSKDCWLGFDLGGTKMLSVVFDAQFESLGRVRKKTNGHEGMEAGMERIERLIRKSLEVATIDPERLAGIGIGCPGPVDMEHGVLCEAVNLGWENVPLQEYMLHKFDCPVFIVNDVDAGVFGEYRFGAAKESRCVLGVFPGTGIGGGCVYEGKIIRGSARSCMEFGHTPMMPVCSEGGKGQWRSLEQMASRLAIAGSAAQAAYRGDAPKLRSLAGTDLSEIRSGIIAKAIRGGDKVIERIVLEAAELIGVAIAGAVLLLAPDTIVLGGGLVEAMPELWVAEVNKAIKKNVLASFRDSFRVVPAQLADDATAIGAAAWAEKMTQ